MIQGQLFGVAATSLQISLRVQLNTTLFAKTLLRKDVATSSASSTDSSEKLKDAQGEASAVAVDADVSTAILVEEATGPDGGEVLETPAAPKDEERDFSSKSQIMTLMTTDVDRVSDFAYVHLTEAVGANTDR